jgi:hypothetical protein
MRRVIIIVLLNDEREEGFGRRIGILGKVIFMNCARFC